MMLRQVHYNLEKITTTWNINVGDCISLGKYNFGRFFSPGHCCMTSSNDDVMYLRAYYVILTTLKNQEMVVAYSVEFWYNSVVYLWRYASNFRTFWSTHVDHWLIGCWCMCRWDGVRAVTSWIVWYDIYACCKHNHHHFCFKLVKFVNNCCPFIIARRVYFTTVCALNLWLLRLY